MRHLIHLIIIFVTCVFISNCAIFDSSKSSAKAEAYWIDVRSANEYSEQHYQSAVNIPHTEIEQKISALAIDKNATIYLYCVSGRRAGIAKDTLETLGYENVINRGGLKDVLENEPPRK